MKHFTIHIIKALSLIILLCIANNKLFSKTSFNPISNSKQFSYSQSSDVPINSFDFFKEIEEEDDTTKERIHSFDSQSFQSLSSSISLVVLYKNEVNNPQLHSTFRLRYNGIPIYNYVNSYRI